MAQEGVGGGEYPLHVIDRTPEYEEFMKRLTQYHIERGTTLDPEPRVSTVHLDLFKVFNLVVASGGYDKVTDEKLLWRKLLQQLGIPTNNPPSTAYSLKEKYYKNLAAFEIRTVHGKEPPPKDILEDVTAKGGSLLTRTRENYHGTKYDSAVGGDSAASDNDGTPLRERAGPETTPVGSSLRASRGLREAPPQRVIYQPDTAPPPRARHASGGTPSGQRTSNQLHQAGSLGYSPGNHMSMTSHSPAPYSNNSRQPRGPSFGFTPPGMAGSCPSLDTYNPQSKQALQMLAVTPVDTPSQNPTEFHRRRQLARQRDAPTELLTGTPGVGMPGAGIYHRCLMGLRSRIFDEEAYALFHLIRISHERGDKFKLEHFSGLAEALVQKTLEVGGLFYDIKWEISFPPLPVTNRIGILDAEHGTPDILQRIESLKPKNVCDGVLPAEFVDQLTLVNEAALVIRNMVTLPENAKFASNIPPLKDLICIVFKLPENDSVVELKHVMLEVCEHLTPWMSLSSTDPLYRVLLTLLDSPDRGKMLGGLRALGRISMNLDGTNQLGDVPARLLENISNWLLLNDDELLDACLDFLYQFTAAVSNVDNLLQSVNGVALVTQLVRLLGHNVKKVERVIVKRHERRMPALEHPVPMPKTLLQDLLKINEPERCQKWVRCFFEEDRESHVTQINAWQAYQAAFIAPLKEAGQALISPAEFIRNATATYKEIKAEVLRPTGNPGETQQKFIIQGIRPRSQAIGLDGSKFQRCEWNMKGPGERCTEFFSSKYDMCSHVFADHLGEVRDADNRWTNAVKPLSCLWGTCRQYRTPTEMRLVQFGEHIQLHTTHLFPTRPVNPEKKDWIIPAETLVLAEEETATVRDEARPHISPQAAGIPLSAALILRNIAQNAPKTRSEELLLKQLDGQGRKGVLNQRLFCDVRPRLLEVFTANRALASHIALILDLLWVAPDDGEN